jgi:hypothetical protein
MTGPTQEIVDFRKDYTSAGCDTFEEAFEEYAASIADRQDFDLFAFEQARSAGGRLAAPAGHHGGGSHPTFTPTPPAATNTPTRTNTPTNTSTWTTTPVPTNTPAGPTSTPAPPTATSTPGAPTATNTPGSGGGGDYYGINPDCNPWGGGACATNTSICSRRIFLIPIIDDYGDPYEIQGFALVFLEGYEGGCSGSSCDIKVRFVKTNATIGQFAGDYIDGGYNNFVKLTE